MSTSEEYDEDRGMLVITVDGTGGHVWGSSTREGKHHIGWWCVESAEAYIADDAVYRTNEVELRKLLGDDVYERTALELEAFYVAEKPSTVMPGSTVKMIPLAVKQRVDTWRKEGAVDELKRSEEVIQDLCIE